ncbi:hypothetical protein C8R46DRAFT_1209998 [Mycena filopes]|nr:hypothetical protein C8R46DRAFT_1209998 [Mycena filopes]
MSALVGFWVAAVLYGINMVVFVSCIRVLHHRGLAGFNRILLLVASIQFMLATAHNIVCLFQLIRGFIDNSAEAVYLTNSIIGDTILIWRLYIVYNRNWWLCGPFLVLLAGTTVCSYSAVYYVSKFSPSDPVFMEALGNWILSTWALSIGATLLIAYRISSTTFTATRTSWRHSAVFWLVIESGAIYSLATVVTLVLYALKQNSGAISGAALGQISCLIPTSIIVRVGFVGASAPSTDPPPRPRRQGGRSLYENDVALVPIPHQRTVDYSSESLGARTYVGSKDDTLV